MFSATLSVGASVSSWLIVTMPSSSASFGEPIARSTPSTSMRPASGASAPEATRASVDLPEPFSPVSACTTPAWSVRSTPSRATTPGKRLVIPVRRSSGGAARQRSHHAFEPARERGAALAAVDRERPVGVDVEREAARHHDRGARELDDRRAAERRGDRQLPAVPHRRRDERALVRVPHRPLAAPRVGLEVVGAAAELGLLGAPDRAEAQREHLDRRAGRRVAEEPVVLGVERGRGRVDVERQLDGDGQLVPLPDVAQVERGAQLDGLAASRPRGRACRARRASSPRTARAAAPGRRRRAGSCRRARSRA